MSSLNRMTFALLGGLTIAGLAMAAEPTTPPAKPKLTPGQEASCLVKITCDPAVLPLTSEVVGALLKSSPVVKSALRSVYGEDVVDIGDVIFEAMGGTVSAGQAGAGLGGYGGPVGGGSRYGAGGAGPAGASRGLGFGGPAAAGRMGGMEGVMGAPDGAAKTFATTTIDESGIQSEVTLLGMVHVSMPVDTGANEVLLAICERLRNALTEVHKMELGRTEETMKLASKEVSLARDNLRRLQETRRTLLDKARQVELTRESVVEMIRRLETEKQEVSLKYDTTRMRKEALERQIAEVGAKIKELRAAPEHPSLAAARAKLDALRQKVEQIKQQVAGGLAPTSEANHAAAELAAAQAELAARTEEMIAAQGGSHVAKLNDELGEISIQMTECMGRLEVLEKRLHEARPLLDATDTYEVDIVLEWPLARQSYEHARAFQESVERRLRSIRPPTVTVVGEK
ncbi:MAG TPA: hypothetical protein PKY77_18875 [Phycisphaerae bacterium]|nr:hypothetical protein [Phycisphaerae bacterium]HRY68474.1 hypothetical protein [Phycisphaerae bacterium]HSA29531.1 hypothetical protein [Phycisphaerae bacterium]